MLIRARQLPALQLPVPDWAGVVRIARLWGVPPEAVLRAPVFWVKRAAIDVAADAFVQAEQAARRE